ncbi:uncharacterized protein LOC120202123 [Hibiscus syriacus]|uniref:uncharacterized protein LOC120202123 n=1 Tax=Hibiscus syriacus TaxID=106335 RepID=UPI0019228D82|nr:uncharacterized protein LOC120202123 [Hibiscus syriacus]
MSSQDFEAAKLREEVSEKQAVAAARRTMTRSQSTIKEKEIAEPLDKIGNKAKRIDFILSKATEAELQKQRDGQQATTLLIAKEAKKKQSRTVAEEVFERMVLVTNKNMDDSLVEARSVDETIA